MPTDDVSVGRIVVAGALIVATVAIVAGVVVAGLTHWNLPLAGPGRDDDAMREPAPALESAPQADLARYRAEKTKLLTTTGWVDEQAGIARIPIATAMTLLSERGLRAGPAASAASAGLMASAAVTASAAAMASDAPTASAAVMSSAAVTASAAATTRASPVSAAAHRASMPAGAQR
jgi:hypothetical protein